MEWYWWLACAVLYVLVGVAVLACFNVLCGTDPSPADAGMWLLWPIVLFFLLQIVLSDFMEYKASVAARRRRDAQKRRREEDRLYEQFLGRGE